jgi:hypothetical protein
MVTPTQPASPQTFKSVGRIGSTSGPSRPIRSDSTTGIHQRAVYRADDAEQRSVNAGEMPPYRPTLITQMGYKDLLHRDGTIESLATVGWHNASFRGKNPLTARRQGSQA